MWKRIIFILSSVLVLSQVAVAQEILSKEKKQEIEQYLTKYVKNRTHAYRISIDSISITKKEIHLFANEPLSHIRFSENVIKEIYTSIGDILPDEFRKRKVKLYSDKYLIDDYVPTVRKDRFENKVSTPLITNKSKANTISKGLQDRHLAIWQSHGWYYEQKLDRWEWQRARIFQTVEDLYTQSYVLPYLVPMLENAGANVLIPRERDTQRHEVIADVDKGATPGTFVRIDDEKEKWVRSESGTGFGNFKEYYLDRENPFEMGTYHAIESVTKGTPSTYEWKPDFPEKGKYGVYVSYKTLPNSSEDAHYIVTHLGGETEFVVNQTMGGGTWIYLGAFQFDSKTGSVLLSNKSRRSGKIVTADAVKFGGGMGNIAREPHKGGEITENIKSSAVVDEVRLKVNKDITYTPQISTYPRYTEAARYWLQWAGVPDSVYTKSEGKNDYTDDYQSRAYWVNYIAGGSSTLPKERGLNIPIDLAMAFHTDAGTTYNDSIIGTLGICMTHHNNEKFENGKPRLLSRDLTHYIMDEIEKDIRSQFEPNWTMRQLWNKSYAEARIPEVPTMLLELLSHQNFADMRYGLDPNFQFTVSRAIYKGMLKFVSSQYKTEYVVQPLPINTFSLDFVSDTQVELKWKETIDPQEISAKAENYIVYTRIDEGGFDNGQLVKGSSVKLNIEKDKIYSYKVMAINAGGESFPSEILSVCRRSNESGNVLIVNGFDRLSAPFSFSTTDSIAGFVDGKDHGVPYINQYNYIGSQKEFRRKMPWTDDDASGFGDSYANYETMVIAGNTFDYPALHGKAIAANGYSFISTSRDAVMDEQVDMKKYKLVDLILGKQKQTKIGRGVFDAKYKTFSSKLQNKIKAYCDNGGNVMVSGAFVGSDLWETETVLKEDQTFAQEVLKYKWRVGQAATEGNVKSVASPYNSLHGNYSFYNKLNPEMYVVESPDAIEPAGGDAHTIMRYAENGLSAAVASSNNVYKTIVFGFPFETVKGEMEQTKLMKNILDFIFEK